MRIDRFDGRWASFASSTALGQLLTNVRGRKQNMNQHAAVHRALDRLGSQLGPAPLTADLDWATKAAGIAMPAELYSLRRLRIVIIITPNSVKAIFSNFIAAIKSSWP